MRLLHEERQEDPAHAAADVDDRPDISPVEPEQRVDERRRASLHRAVEDLRLLGIVGEDLPVRPALSLTTVTGKPVRRLSMKVLEAGIQLRPCISAMYRGEASPSRRSSPISVISEPRAVRPP